MVAASKADGHIDATRHANILGQLDKLGVDNGIKTFLLDELRKPLDVDAVAAGVTTPEEAAEIYTASLLVVDVDNLAEQQYLALLAKRLGLEPALVEYLHKTVDTETVRV